MTSSDVKSIIVAGACPGRSAFSCIRV